MSLQEQVAQAFASGGLLGQLVPAITPRAGQQRMAQEVARTIEHGGVLVAEAGTGVGKTYAYLVPALLSGERTLISTATKALQDQLFNRDIPRILKALGTPVRAVLLKGRSSYLCLHRLGVARQLVHDMGPTERADLAQVVSWAQATASGDLAEIPTLEDNSAVIPWVTSTRENCLGGACAQAGVCHVNLARRAAMAADVVVINHHLFFADLKVRESGVAELLPSATTVVFDEAHQLNDVGVNFLASQWSGAQLESLCRDLSANGALLALGCANWRALVDELRHAEQRLRALCGSGTNVRLAWVGAAPEGVDARAWEQSLSDLVERLHALDAVLVPLQDYAPVLRALRERASALLQALEVFSESADAATVRWIECGRNLRLVQSPLTIADAMGALVMAPGSESEPSRRSWIFTSATLGHDAALSWFVQSCGVQGADVLHIESPFDYARQAVMHVPADFPQPSDPDHSASVALLTAQAVQVLGGRTLVLTTTLRAMRSIGAALQSYFTAQSGIEVLVQGMLSKRELIARFCQPPTPGRPGSVLVASASFWEGIDVVGEALQLVVIDKLPFAPPDDPLVQARAQALQAQGKKPFAHLHLPHAAIALKQGVGRLIRSETDCGGLLICDVRLTQKSYAKKILAALPPMAQADSYDAFLQALQALTRFSTTDLGRP